MFYKSIKAGCEEESIRIGLPEDGHGKHGAVLATGFVAFKAKFLSRAELDKLVNLARREKKNSMAYWKTLNMFHSHTLAARTFGSPIGVEFFNGYLKALEDNSVLTAIQLSELRNDLAAVAADNAN